MKGILRVLADGWRSALTLILLFGALLLVVVLALQAQDAWRHQRDAAEGVLRSYGRLVADEFIRRSSLEVGYRGFHAVVMMLQHRLGGVPEPVLPEPSALTERAEAGAAQPRDLARTLFLWDPGSDRLDVTGATLDEQTGAWLREQLRERVLPKGGEAGPLSAIHTRGPSGQRIFIATPLAAAPGRSPRVAGFEASAEALSEWFRRTVDARPLIPPSLGEGDLTNDLLFLRLTDETGRVIHTSGTWPGALLAVETPLGDAYSGVFDGLKVQVCIDPQAAPRLVIGGLPASRLPLLIGLMVLTAGLFTASVWQMRRERALSRMRSDFVARVSHELRTPLTQIRMFAETLLLERTRTPEERRRSLEIIDQEARRLSHLVANILQFSRAERGTVRLNPRLLDPAGALKDVVEKFHPVAAARGVRVEPALEEGTEIRADEEALAQVVLNLLDNAVKYGPPGQEVRLSLERRGDVARITVEDQGPGVPDRDRERIWRRWQRLSRDEGRAISGTGIGLTVVRDLIELHAGRAWVEPGGRGGACFVVELPVGRSESLAHPGGGLAGQTNPGEQAGGLAGERPGSPPGADRGV